ncbi:MAG TPA: hypothetical protein VNO31_38255 [Umezawaea sp.]|nr:hypothetical protein [Umezawaea sp.]
MRFTTAVTVLAALALGGGCASGHSTSNRVSPGPPAETASPEFDWGGALTEAFNAANVGAPWFPKVRTLTVDGKAVVVTSSLTEAEPVDALAVCEAASTVARISGQGYTSVAVRTADGGTTLAHLDELTSDSACRN